MICGKCKATSIRLERYQTEEDGLVTIWKCLICGNSSDSKKWGFYEEGEEVQTIGTCKVCERPDMSLAENKTCSACRKILYSYPPEKREEAIAAAREKFYGKPKAEVRNRQSKPSEAAEETKPVAQPLSVAREIRVTAAPLQGKHEATGKEIGKLVDVKNAAYGEAFAKCGDFLKLLYPGGIEPEQYADMLGLVRVFDKMMRIATAKEALGENPWGDIAGYGILKASL